MGEQNVRPATVSKATAEQVGTQPVQTDAGVGDEQFSVRSPDGGTTRVAAVAGGGSGRCGDRTPSTPQLDIQTDTQYQGR
jgi:hypothetical protein